MNLSFHKFIIIESWQWIQKGIFRYTPETARVKQTAALGLSIRAAGHGLKTYMGQFMKGQHYGELTALRDNPCITIEQYGDIKCIHRDQVTQKNIDQAEHGLIKARDAMLSGQYDIVILDEINVTIWF